MGAYEIMQALRDMDRNNILNSSHNLNQRQSLQEFMEYEVELSASEEKWNQLVCFLIMAYIGGQCLPNLP